MGISNTLTGINESLTQPYSSVTSILYSASHNPKAIESDWTGEALGQ